MAETQLARWRRIHGAAELSGIWRNDEKEEERKDSGAQTTGQGEEMPAWAASFQQKLDSLHGRMDEIEAKSKGGVPEVEDGQEGTERTAVAKDSTGNAEESAGNGDIAARKFREAEEAEEHAQAEYAGQGESPVTASQGEQERLQRSRAAGPEEREYNPDLEDGVDRFNTQGQRRDGEGWEKGGHDREERRDYRGHGEDKRDHHSSDRMDAMLGKANAQIKELTARVNQAFRQPSIEERNAIAATRKRADGVYSALGRETPEWLPGESVRSFRRRCADGLKEFSAGLKKTVMDALPEDVFNAIEEKIYADAQEATKRSDVTPPMVLRPHTYMDKGREITEYHGDPMVWMAPFMSPGAVSKVTKIANNAN